MVDFSGTFDSTNALSGMFLWLIFGYLASLLNCDMQRILAAYPIALHVMGLVAFIFLFTLLDSNNKTSLDIIYAKSAIVYALFVLMVKSKWYFILPVMFLLLVDQSIKKHVAYKEAAGKKTPQDAEMQAKATQTLNVLIIALILIGCANYMYLQYLEYGDAFSLYKFFFGVTKCKANMPDYAKISRSK